MDDDLRRINTSIAFTSALLFAISISIYIQVASKDMIINGRNSKHTQEEIYDLSMLVSSIFFIVVIYFFIVNLEQYKKNKSKNNEAYLIAAVFSLLAESIRLSTLANTPLAGSVTSSDILP